MQMLVTSEDKLVYSGEVGAGRRFCSAFFNPAAAYGFGGKFAILILPCALKDLNPLAKSSPLIPCFLLFYPTMPLPADITL